MKVLAAIVVPPHLSVSGAARAAEKLSAELARIPEIDIDVASMADQESDLRPEGRPAAGNVPGCPAVRVTNPLSWTSRFLPNRFRTLFYRSSIPKLVRTGSYDLVHIHNPTPGLEMKRVARAARRAGVPYVVSTHGFVEIADGARINRMGPALRTAWNLLARRPVSWVVRNADMMLLLSSSDRAVVERLGGGPVRTALVPNGVAPPAEPRPDALDSLDLPESTGDELRAFFLANHTPNKGLPVLLESFESLSNPFTLVVGGEKRDMIDYERHSSEEPGRRVVFTGSLSDEQVAGLFDWADMFVFPTLADTLPLVVLEAMSHGTPVVASDVGGISFELEDGSGVLVPPGDAAALAQVVGALADDREELARMGKAAEERAEVRFSWESAASDAFIAYERCLDAEDALNSAGTRS